MYLILKNGRTINIYNSLPDAEFFHKTRHQKNLYKIENSIEEITEEQYYNLLESSTPIFISGYIFANPEPMEHFLFQSKKVSIYQGAFQKGGKYYQFLTTLENIKKLMPFDFQV